MGLLVCPAAPGALRHRDQAQRRGTILRPASRGARRRQGRPTDLSS
jgi:hypothetical protein